MSNYAKDYFLDPWINRNWNWICCIRLGNHQLSLFEFDWWHQMWKMNLQNNVKWIGCFHSPAPRNEANGQWTASCETSLHGRALTGHLNEWVCHSILHFICKQKACHFHKHFLLNKNDQFYEISRLNPVSSESGFWTIEKWRKISWKWNENAIHSFREVQVKKMAGNWDQEVKVKWKSFEIEKWNFSKISLSLFSRNENEIEMIGNRDREVKVK